MPEIQFCPVCKKSHNIDDFEHFGGGWNDAVEWVDLTCLHTGESFRLEWLIDEESAGAMNDN